MDKKGQSSSSTNSNTTASHNNNINNNSHPSPAVVSLIGNNQLFPSSTQHQTLQVNSQGGQLLSQQSIQSSTYFRNVSPRLGSSHQNQLASSQL